MTTTPAEPIELRPDVPLDTVAGLGLIHPVTWGEMRDAGDPLALADWDNGAVQGYPNRVPPWTPADFRRFEHQGIMRTSVRREAYWAAIAREIDVETGAAQIEDVPGFIVFREHLGHDDGGLYISLNKWPAQRQVLEDAAITNARCRIRIADWTRTPRRIGPDELGRGWEAWCHQFENVPGPHGGYDRNAYWGDPGFARDTNAGVTYGTAQADPNQRFLLRA